MSEPHPCPPGLSIQLLGEPQFLRNEVPWQGKRYDKVIALLAYLLAEGDRGHSREHLAALLWPSLSLNAARTNLRQSLYYLRQFFQDSADTLLHTNRESVRYVHTPELCRIDLKTLTEQAPTCPNCPTTALSPPCEQCLERIKSRADSYQGEFLAGLSLADTPDFDVWLDAQRQSLRARAFSCAERLRNAYEALGRLGPAIAYAQRCVQLEPWNEAGHREHMRLLAVRGQHGTAEALYDAYRESLARDLNVEPEYSTHSLFETIHKREIEPQEELAPANLVPETSAPPTGRRQATILCCHIDLPAGAHPEAPELLAQARSLCATLMRKHAGHIAVGQGGFIYAYIGYPQASEHAGELAIQTALELNTHFASRYRLRIGIHTGIILAGFDPALPDIVGNVSTVAWQLCKRLQKSGIVISESTRLLLPERFQFSQSSPLLVAKEDALNQYQPMAAHRVTGLLPPHAKPHQASKHTDMLIGRKAELRYLKGLWDRACAGEPQFIVISGEPGMGKTRLAGGLRQLAEAAPCMVRHLHCYPELQHTPLYAVIAMFEDIMGLSVEDSMARQQEKLKHYLHQYHPAIAEQAAPLLMGMLSIAPSDAPVLPPRQRKLQTLDMLLTLLDSMARQRPLLLLIEDAQWLDMTSRDLLERLVQRCDELTLLTLVTARPEFQPSWLRRDSVLRLTPLKDEHIARLARSVCADLPRTTVERIVQRADGIPLYAEEMAHIAQDPQDETIPATLQYLLLARLDAVPHARRVLQLAATLGRKFEKGPLLRVSGLKSSELDKTLEELIEARLIAPILPGHTFQFHHALIQEAAYGSQVASDRRAAHLKVARALDSYYAQRAIQQPGELARHFTAAGATDSAVPWWLLAGRQALRVSACAEAAGHLQTGLGLVSSLPPSPQRDQLERELLLVLGQALLLLRGYGSEDAADIYDRALALDSKTAPLSERFEILWGQWMVSSSRKGSSFSRSWELTQRLLRLALESGKPYLLALAYSAATNISLWRNQLEEACQFAQEAVEQPLSAQETSEGLDPQVTSLAHASWALWRLDRAKEALAASNQSIEIARARQNPDTQCFALAFGAMLHRFLGDADTAGHYAHEAKNEAERHGMALWKGVGDMLLGWKQAYDGNPAGLDLLHACVRGVQRVMPSVAVMFHHALADAYGLLGRHSEQLQAVDAGLHAAHGVHEGFFSSLLQQMRLESLARQTPQ